MQNKYDSECAVCPFASKCSNKWLYVYYNPKFSGTTLPRAKPLVVNGEIQTTFSTDSLAIATGAAQRIYEMLYDALTGESQS